MSLPAHPKPWERQERDTDKSWAAFVYYRDMGASRNLRIAAEELGYSDATTLWKWSWKYDWTDRVRAWDIEQDRVRRKAHLEEVEEMSRRHARRAKEIGEILARPAAEIVKRMKELEGVLGSKTVEQLLEMMGGVAWAYPQIAKLERLARGEPTDITSGEVTHRDDVSRELEIAERIRNNPDILDKFYALVDALQSDAGGDSADDTGHADALRDGREIQGLSAHQGLGPGDDAGGDEARGQADRDSPSEA